MRPALALLQRILGFVIVFFGVTFVIYFAVFSLPGDPIRALAGDRAIPQGVIDALHAQYRLDQPLWQQYSAYIGGLFHGDFGIDFRGRPVGEQMLARWPVTIALALTAWGIEVVLGVAIGVISALRKGTVIDKSLLALTVLASCIPVFVLGAVAQLVFGVSLGWLPVAGVSDGWPISYILPAAVIAVFGLAAVSRLVRSSVIESLGSDYVRTARAKGLGEPRVVGVHVMRNSLIPASTFLATDLGYLLGGTVIIEGIFNLPGVGNLLFSAIRSHEGATVVGVSTALILIFLITTIVVDALHAVLDPRSRLG
ncbi:ABC transporter permease [Salinibacterium sp. SYSU T00001]|uniref:ABC transporter permease n=1 Tax=Homoserinimonas sedimenticola TaxID=2986805 RepID=UPI00223643D4|nr:ABC transporter permease [Salinibacterium sedimenticola]MCW4384692.1 ABC transporter permease [Salinibacterium sedimenticola]